ncbi:hypothetical protein [Natrinema pallidum]|uniref:DUF7344 domain-containing protein n=2 Tax=Natrinema pallidum TaxID=69527 RepID=L9Z7B9_9EURY|nr:hypothetical protein [Natrinema pallidum]ELY82269.1 hypothetical protein C487_02553 [Natrinema pallidum DSM 3751]QCW03606.1 hypothetical protein FGF80_10280 [Natrinema pallidum]
MSNTARSGSAAAARDELFDALADTRRRTVLRLVRDRTPQGIGKDDLALRFAAVTADKRLATVTDDDHHRALVALHHRHLPRLTDAGLLEETDNGLLRVADRRMIDDLGAVVTRSDREPTDAGIADAVSEAPADGR